MGLLEFQRKNLTIIKEALICNFKCQIVGNIGIGRAYTLNHLRDEYCVIFIENDKNDLTYMPLINALKKYEDYTKLFDIDFSLGINFSCFSLDVGVQKKNLDAIESELLKVIKKLRKQKKVLFVLRNEQLNQSIAGLLSKIKAKEEKTLFSKIHEVRFVYLTSENLNSPEFAQVHFLTLSFSDQPRKSVLKEMNLNEKIIEKLTSREIEFIFSLVEDDLGCLKELIDKMNNHSISFADNTDNSNLIYSLINKHYKDDIQRDNINNLLSFCSFSEDFLLSENDLVFLLDRIEVNDLKNYINYAQNKRLVALSDDKINVFIILLKNIYKEQFDSQKGKIYNKLCSMISNLYPSNYKQKIIYAKLANDTNLDIYTAQYYMQRIRESGECIELESNTSFKYYSLLSAYKKAYAYMSKKEYEKIETLFADFTFLPFCLSAEIKLLICQAKTKFLNTDHRAEALKTLNNINGKNLDGNLKYRLEYFKIITNVHNGNYKEARGNYDSLLNELTDKINNYPSEELTRLFYTLCRKNNMIYNFQSSFISIKKAKDYFNNCVNLPQDKYFALVNYFGIAIRNLKLKEAKNALDEIEELKSNYCYRNFSREYIFENNRIIYDYLSEIPVTDVMNSFKTLSQRLPKSADKFLIVNNYAVFTAIYGDIDEAIKILNQIKDENIIDLEGVYQFRYTINSTIFNYIKDNGNKEKLIDELNKLDLNIDYPNRTYMLNERNLVIATVNEPCANSSEWLRNFKNRLPGYRAENGYELGFVITPLFHWSDD